MAGAVTGTAMLVTTTTPSGRGFAAIATTDQWLRCGHANTALEPDTEVVTLGWEAVEGVTAWRPDAPPLVAAGLAFDPHGCLYHADPERGQIQRVPWRPSGAVPADAAPVDLLAPPPVLPAGDFTPVAPQPGLHVRAIALAADPDEHLFVLDSPTRAIHVLDLADGRLVRTITLPWPAVDLAARDRAILVATDDRGHPLVEVSALGTPREVPLATHVATELASVPASATPLRVAVGPAGQLWLLLRDGTGAWAVPVEDARRTAVIPVPGASDIELDGAGRLVVAGPPGADFHRFALTRTADVMVGPLRGRNFDGRGIARTPDGRIGFWTSRGFRVAVEARRRFLRSGHVDCFRLDSGTYQQQWGRVFVEACGPKGARVRVGFATSDEEPGLLEPHGPSIPRDPPLLLEGDDHPLPPEFPPLVATGLVSTVSRPWELHRRETGSELPWLCRTDPADRFEVYEAPVQAPPGRYLWLRLMLDGTTSVTPRIRAVRAEFPGHDLLRRLPRAYSRDVAAASFLRRYLALADGLLSEIQDRAVRRDLLLDPFGAPPEMLPWLASLVGLTLDERWPELARRTMLAEAICLFRRRGTVAGLRRMLKIYLDCDVVILESFRMRGTGGASLTGDAGGAGPQGAANAVVGFGFRVGGEVGEQTAQPLSGTAADAFQTHAHRFSVIVPRDLDGEQLDTVGHLLDLHRPAHTLVEVCTVGRGMRVGLGLHVEVSTVVGRSSGFRRAVLGGHRLGTNAVIGKPRAGVRPGASRLGTDTVVDQ